jgi:hypothetical protein
MRRFGFWLLRLAGVFCVAFVAQIILEFAFSLFGSPVDPTDINAFFGAVLGVVIFIATQEFKI